MFNAFNLGCSAKDKSGRIYSVYLATKPTGLVVRALTSGTQVHGFKPGRSRRIFRGEKILSMPSFGGEVRSSVLCRSFAACNKSLQLPWKPQFLAHSSPFLCQRSLASSVHRVVQSSFRLQCPRWGNPPALQKKKQPLELSGYSPDIDPEVYINPSRDKL
jgi:hypothetical protein